MFQLTTAETEALRSQIVISNEGRGGRRYSPYVFTEQGVAMLSGVLRSDRAIAVNIEIRRAFVELRRAAGSFDALQKRLDQLELDIGARLSEHDDQLRQIFEPLRQLIEPPVPPRRPIGFRVRDGDNLGGCPAPCRGSNTVRSSRFLQSRRGKRDRARATRPRPGGSECAAESATPALGTPPLPSWISQTCRRVAGPPGRALPPSRLRAW